MNRFRRVCFCWCLAGLLSACDRDAGTTPAPHPPASSASAPAVSPVPPDTVETAPERSLHYQRHGQAQQITAYLTDSPNGDYRLYLPQGYSLMAEEPGHDVVLSEQSERAMLRLAVHPASEAAWTQLLQQMSAGLAAGGTDGASVAITPVLDTQALPQPVQRSAMMRAKHATGDVTGVVFEHHGLMVRLTIWDDPAQDLGDLLLRIGASVQPVTKGAS